jgi:DHA2 family multidrug resistance protein
LGLILFMPRSFGNFNLRFDWIGFVVLSLGIGGLQVMLDRGQVQDWFTSTEVIAEAVIGGSGVYLFIVHMVTANKPVIPIVLFKDRNFAVGLALMFAIGTILVSSSSLLAPWLQNLANYPVETAGLIMAPRGIGTMAAMMTGGRLAGRLDPRQIMAAGILMLSWSVWEMTTWTPAVSQWTIMITIMITIMVQGAGLGLAFLPLQVLAFATLPPHYRTDGASLFSLFRNIGAAVGVSITSSMLAHNIQVLHESIGASVTPFNRTLQGGRMISRAWNPIDAHGAAMLDQMVNQQAQISAYIDDYWMMTFTTLPSLALLLLLRRPKHSSSVPEKAHVAMD